MKAAKAYVAAAGLVVTALTAAFADNILGVDDVGALATALATAVATVVAVYQTPNKPAE